MAMLCTVMAWAVNITTSSELQSFLETAGTNTGVIAADLTGTGVHFLVAGTKELTINNGVTLSLTSAYNDKEEEQPNGYDGHGFCFYVQNGANLTVKGDGTIAADRSVFFVEEGGELTIGESSKATQLKVTTSEGRVKQRIVVVKGSASVYNADMVGRSGVIWNSGPILIDGGTYLGKSSDTDKTASKSGLVAPLSDQYTYAVNGQGAMILKNATIKGVHGALCPAAGGRVEVDNCTIISDPAFADYTGADSYYGMYLSTYGIGIVRNSKIYAAKSNRYAISIGNNDTQHTYGILYLFENCYLHGKENSYPYIKKKGAYDDDILFPVEIDTTSAWYRVAKTGTVNVNADPTKIIHMPLPSNIEYQVVSETFDGRTYELKTVSTIPAEKQEELAPTSDPTIPWQETTTWVGGDVPTEESAVNIPEGKTVVVDKNNAEKTAEANQVNIAGAGASLTVQDGTTLNITNSLNISTGAKLVVDAGAVVTVGAGGVVASSADAIEVKTSEGRTGTFMIAPTVTENTHPMATVELVSKAYKRGENDYVWQRFGVPSHIEGVKRSDLIYDHVAYPTSVMKVVNQNWANMDQDDVFIPFKCYALTTSAATAGAIYTFQCNLMGNGDAELQLTDNWNYYANSYTAPIDIAQMIGDFSANYPNVSATVYLYRASDDWWYEINNANIGETGIPSQIDPMQAFIFERRTSGSNPIVNYLNQIWNPIMNPSALTAPQRNASFSKAIVEVIAADGTKDMVRLIEGNQFSNNFDNSYDATKYMNSESFNLFASGMEGEMAILATNNLVGTMLDMTTKEQTSFTMTFSNVNGMDYAIRDNLTNTETVIAEGATYMFSVPENTTVEGRFEIVNINRMPTAIDNVEESASQNGIYTITGQYVGNDYHSLPAGIYVVDGKKVVK